RPDIKAASAIIESALLENRSVLTTIESKAILKAFFIPVSESQTATTKEEAITIAKNIGFPLVMKILSPDISHKQEAQGVALNITNEKTAQETFDRLLNSAKKVYPN